MGSVMFQALADPLASGRGAKKDTILAMKNHPGGSRVAATVERALDAADEWARRENGARVFRACFWLAAAYVFFCVILDWDKNWMHQDFYSSFLPAAMKTGPGLCLQDLGRMFDFGDFDGNPRVRFLSSLTVIAAAKLRIWLAHVAPPHPSISPTWIFSLVFSPMLLFSLMKRLRQPASVAWTAATLYLVSTGLLSGVTFLFHPAKPLSLFATLLCLYLAARVRRPAPDGSDGGTIDRPAFAMLMAAAFLSFFVDEVDWFIVACVPIFFPSTFIRRPRLGLLFSGAFAAFLLCVTFIVPAITARLGIGDFLFWKYSVSSNGGLSLSGLLHSVWTNGVNLNLSHLRLVEGGWLATAAGGAALLLILGFSAILPAAEKSLALRGLAALAAYVVFETFIMSRHLHVIASDFYYGSLFSLLAVIPLSVVLAGVRRALYLRLALFLYLAAVSIGNFERDNRRWMHDHRYALKGLCTSPLREQLQLEGPLPFSLVREFWENRGDPAFAPANAARLPAKACWMLLELSGDPATLPQIKPPRFDPGSR